MVQSGFYTQAELLRQIARPPLSGIAARGFGFKLLVGEQLPNDFPPVGVWSDGLSFGLTNAALTAIARRVAVQHGVEQNHDEEQHFVAQAFPCAPRPTGDTHVMPLYVAQSGGRNITFDPERQQPYGYDSFGLEHPGRYELVRVPLQVMGTDLVATVPDDMLRELLDVCEALIVA